MRRDWCGLFWEDAPVVKVLKEKVPKRTPPERTWESPDYLPGLEEALAFKVDLFTDAELLAAAHNKERLVYDIECYPNYFLIAFRSVVSKKVVYFERTPTLEIDQRKLHWVLTNFTNIGFNSINYDAPMAALALAGKTNAQLEAATLAIIKEDIRTQDLLKKHKVKKLVFDHIDLIEVAPLFASLKIYGGRLHIHKMQDLPFPPGTVLSENQIAIVRWYCINDLDATDILYKKLEKEIELREVMSKEYGIDLRSKSDAQVAEAVISQEVNKLNGSRAQKREIAVGTTYKYKAPPYLKFNTEAMNWVFSVAKEMDLVVGDTGKIGIPDKLKGIKIPIGEGRYKIGVGGLHSTEKRSAQLAGDDILKDIDVESYYPRIILRLGLYPMSLGPNFLKVYNTIVVRRLHAKAMAKKCKDEGDAVGELQWKVVADSLKITINGSFGKFGSKYSILYSPDLLIQTTVTGQLALLMLIERLELQRLNVLSANTDGIIVRCPKDREQEVAAIIKQWEIDTGFTMEENQYKAVYSRDVNNYIAIKSKGGVKLKGAYSETGLHKNPTNRICVDAVVKFLTEGTPVIDTITGCTDIRQFVTVRKVNAGAVKNGIYLGGSIRWYYAANEEGEIIYAKSGNKVPLSEGAKPCMTLPDKLPDDIDYGRYERDSNKILKLIGYLKPESEAELAQLEAEIEEEAA